MKRDHHNQTVSFCRDLTELHVITYMTCEIWILRNIKREAMAVIQWPVLPECARLIKDCLIVGLECLAVHVVILGLKRVFILVYVCVCKC